MVGFYLLRSHAFHYGSQTTISVFHKNRTYDFRTSRCTWLPTRPLGRVRPNNNHAALVERFQPSALHERRQLGLYTNTDTPDTAHLMLGCLVLRHLQHGQHAAELIGRGKVGPYPEHLQRDHGPPSGGALQGSYENKEGGVMFIQ